MKTGLHHFASHNTYKLVAGLQNYKLSSLLAAGRCGCCLLPLPADPAVAVFATLLSLKDRGGRACLCEELSITDRINI